MPQSSVNFTGCAPTINSGGDRSFCERLFGSVNERVDGFTVKNSGPNLLLETYQKPSALSIARTIIPASSDLPLYSYGV